MIWLATLQGRVVTLAAAAMAIWGWLKVHDYKVASKAVDSVVQASEIKGAQNAAKSKKAYDAARAPGAADRLRADPKTCIDCR